MEEQAVSLQPRGTMQGRSSHTVVPTVQQQMGSKGGTTPGDTLRSSPKPGLQPWRAARCGGGLEGSCHPCRAAPEGGVSWYRAALELSLESCSPHKTATCGRDPMGFPCTDND